MTKSLDNGDCHEPTALAMTVYLRLNFNLVIGANNSVVTQEYA